MKLSVDIEQKLGHFRLQSCFTADAERFALLGASGCGKTMTLKCIAGIEKPDRGRITLGDRVLFDSEKRISLPARERRVGYLFQNYALFPHMTVRKNIAAAAKDPAEVDFFLERFCIQDVADQYPVELSGGQSQRTALARMLVTKPEVLLLDEPFSALDNYMRTRMEHEILDILEEFRGPSVLVTHDRNEAYRLADRIGVMEAGNIVETQDRREFFDHPMTVAAARLTGCKNISALKKDADGAWLAEDWGIRLKPVEGQDFTTADHVGYRAHFFKEISKEQLQDTNCFCCRLERIVEDTFSVVICFTEENGTGETADALLTWIVDKTKWEEMKDRVLSGSFYLTLDPERLMLLKSNTPTQA